MKRVLFLAALIAALSAGTAIGVEPDEVLKDPALESRAREISKELRCLVCQNQSIDDSNAALARDLRILVRERLKAGDNDTQVVDFVVDRYGDFVLLNPPFKTSTLLLWGGPALFLLLGGLGVVAWFRSRREIAESAPLSDEEKRRLDALLDGNRET